MQKLIEGIRVLEREIFPGYAESFAALAKGQNPQALFITCSDSRIVPSLITSSGPGDLFVVRNPGNIVPPSRGPANGAGAAIEYAVYKLGVGDIVVCGHTCCGAMEAVANEAAAAELPQVAGWVRHASNAKAEAARRHAPHGSGFLRAVIEENVLLQIRNTRTYRIVADREAGGRLRLHAWVYDMENGRVLTHDAVTGEFRPIASPRLRTSRADAMGVTF
jgi:carbonic anhydrase